MRPQDLPCEHHPATPDTYPMPFRFLRRASAPEAKTQAALSLHDLPQPVWTPRDYGALAREGYARNPSSTVACG